VSLAMRVLALDIETSPNLAYVWNLWNENVNLERLVESGEMLCFAAKWIGERRKMLWYAGAKHPDQSDSMPMIRAAHDLLDEADAVIHVNGRRFDVPHLNREFVLAGMTPPAPYKQIDLYRVVKRQFKFPSYKLAYVAEALGVGSKVKHDGFDLWTRCMAGDLSAWREMARYNKHDVTLVERLHDVLQPWITDYPNRALYDDIAVAMCPGCGGTDLISQGFAYTRVGKFQRYLCSDCGRWSQSGARIATVELRPVAA
jgi:RNase_H superfamily